MSFHCLGVIIFFATGVLLVGCSSSFTQAREKGYYLPYKTHRIAGDPDPRPRPLVLSYFFFPRQNVRDIVRGQRKIGHFWDYGQFFLACK